MPPLTVTAMVSLYNEQDMIGEVIENLLDNDLHVVVLDNGSTDGSFEICRAFAPHERLSLHRWFPEGLDLERLSRHLYRLACRSSPDWLVFCDADEILETAHAGITVRGAIERAAAAGENVLQCNRFDFFMSDLDDPLIPSPVERLRHYSWQGDFNYRAFEHVPGVRAAPSFAHYPLFPAGHRYKVSPDRLVLRHYPYRSATQAERKITNLLEKISLDPGTPRGWHRRYVRIAADGRHTGAHDHRLLARYDDDHAWDTAPKHRPFTNPQPTREEWFTPDGFLRTRPKPKIEW